MPRTWDVIVLGVGGFGSGALFHLARRGLKVLGIEQYGVAHDHGSSHGESRIIRLAYFEHPDYVPLLRRAFEHWRELEQRTQRTLLHQTGLFLCGPAEGEAVSGTRRAAAEHRLPLESLTPAEAASQFPEFSFPPDCEVVFEQQAGWLSVEACVAAHVDQARQAGGALHCQERVERWTADGRSVRVWTDRGMYEAGGLVITAGPWASRVLSGLGVPFRVLRKVQLWFGVREGSYREAPCFLYERPEGVFYGFPSLEGATIKVAEHTGGEEVDDPALVDRRCHPQDVAPAAAFVRQCLPRTEPQVLRHSVCLYTMSPDGHFVVDRHPEWENVVFGAGFSGHGFKFTGVLGEVLADLVSRGTTTLPAEFLRLSRLSAGLGRGAGG